MKRLCIMCRERPAKFLYQHRIKADRHHPLCLKCWRTLKAQLASRKLKEDCWWSYNE